MWMGRDLGVRVRAFMMISQFSMKDRCRFIEHARTAARQATATLDVLAVRHAKSTRDVTQGKGLLADAVRMLVARVSPSSIFCTAWLRNSAHATSRIFLLSYLRGTQSSAKRK